ncbi:MAG TPA: 3-deoxy-manno-octulosonate cytidylyltransferase [Phycisphaerales bacterium]|nr:3-deoxy-manno-octulosonate cytidylyltransferase [Phycisphaerales bacterium]
MNTVVIIPARYASTRLPGKPLLAETGRPLIAHVVEAVRAARGIDRVVVATDDKRIAGAVRAFGGEAVMTSTHCRTGTDRLAEAAATLGLADDDIVLNIQGDEPEIPPACVESLARLLRETDAPMATLATPLPAAEAANPNKVKVVLDARGMALYFSRARIPHDRDGAGFDGYLLHLGAYAYRVAFLKQYAVLPQTPAEQAEKLEQLRALEHGRRIAVAVVEYDGAGIDTPEDYAAFVSRQKKRK